MPSQRFLNVIDHILEHEGGYNDIKNDSGGATNYGISLRFLQSINEDINNDGSVDWIDIKQLTKKKAIELYWNNFWRAMYDKMPVGIGEKVFDFAVNAGHMRSHRTLQAAVNRLGGNLKVDGMIGSVTLAALKNYSPQSIMAEFIKEQASFYQALVKQEPKNKIFLKGWLNRANYNPLN
jgi:lysozyme family protein